jgi:hypothetical protein
MKKVILPQAELYFISSHILKVDMLNQEELGLDEVKELLDAVFKLANGKPYCMLTDLRRCIGASSNEARQYAADHSMPSNKIADAMITDSLAKKLTANFYIQFNKPKSPTRLFTSEDLAIKWLNNKFRSATGKKTQYSGSGTANG